MSGFTPYSAAHGLATAVSAVIVLAWVMLGRSAARRGEAGREAVVRACGAGAMLMGQVLMQLYWSLPQRFEWETTLPLHACDLGAWLSPLALLLGWRWLRVMLIFWGFGFATQAFIQPTLVDGPGELQFYFYWLNHATIIATALYGVVVWRLRPTFREFVGVVSLTAVWTVTMAVVNWRTGWDYMFVGPGQPEQRTIVDVLGPWPWRVPVIMLIGTGVFFVVWAVLRGVCGREPNR